MKSAELVTAVESGHLALIQVAENKFQVRDVATGEIKPVSHLTARSAVKSLDQMKRESGEGVIWMRAEVAPVAEKVPQEDAQEAATPDVGTQVETNEEGTSVNLDELDDAAFAAAVIAGKGRKAKTGAPAEKKSAKTNPGMYVGERRKYPTRPGKCKDYWDTLTDIWEQEGRPTDFHIDAEQIRKICSIFNWSVSSFSTDYRQWRLYHGIEVKQRAPAMSRTISAPKDEARAVEREEDVIEDAQGMDDINVQEV